MFLSTLYFAVLAQVHRLHIADLACFWGEQRYRLVTVYLGVREFCVFGFSAVHFYVEYPWVVVVRTLAGVHTILCYSVMQRFSFQRGLFLIFLRSLFPSLLLTYKFCVVLLPIFIPLSPMRFSLPVSTSFMITIRFVSSWAGVGGWRNRVMPWSL